MCSCMERYRIAKRWMSFSQLKNERRESATVAVALVKGEYEKRWIMMEQHFEVKPDSGTPTGRARVCMCPAVTVTPSQVVKPDSYAMGGECIHKRDARICKHEDAAQSLFQSVVGTESEFNIKRI